ncbi:DedA family protein [Catenovulum sp. 2E275]|uniref:YqaA family protein n=1 Tax=Catenovulum sp. 2E275 TaxID=2980497 RepID=UPI0021D17B03|nr:YqaA family protein [Catenovulum sp. 2E275]MCU4676129.1 DedA family protein [Catenovulum sp. 2E275]
MSYLVLFSSSLLAATILPFYSEFILFALIKQGEPAWLLVLVATAGNTLGSVINWYIGRYLLKFKHKKWFYFKDAQIEKAQNWFGKYGVWTLLFAWLPLGGDVLTLIAGIMRVHILPFILLVGIGKFLRYVAVLYASQISLALI